MDGFDRPQHKRSEVSEGRLSKGEAPGVADVGRLREGSGLEQLVAKYCPGFLHRNRWRYFPNSEKHRQEERAELLSCGLDAQSQPRANNFSDVARTRWFASCARLPLSWTSCILIGPKVSRYRLKSFEFVRCNSRYFPNCWGWSSRWVTSVSRSVGCKACSRRRSGSACPAVCFSLRILCGGANFFVRRVNLI